MNFRASLLGSVVLSIEAFGLFAQSEQPGQGRPTSVPKWEVASIRRCDQNASGGRGGGGALSPAGLFANTPGRLTQTCQTVAGLISAAYVIYRDGQHMDIMAPLRMPIEGGPAWIRNETYTITAKAEGAPNRPMMAGPMMQALLEERFNLKLRLATRDNAVYALTVARGGSKLHAFQAGSCIPTNLASKLPAEAPNAEQKRCRNFSTISGSTWIFDQQAIDLDTFASMISIGLGRPVVDRTGIGGVFDFTFTYANPSPGGATAESSTAPSIFSAVSEFGLRLEPTRGQSEYLFVERVDRPTEN